MQPRRSPRARRAVLDCAHIWSCGSKQIQKQKQIQVQIQIHIQIQKHVCLSLCSHNSGPASQNRFRQFFKLKETIHTNPQVKHGCGRKLGWSGSQQVQHSWLFVWPMGGGEWANWHLGRVEAGCTNVYTNTNSNSNTNANDNTNTMGSRSWANWHIGRVEAKMG